LCRAVAYNNDNDSLVSIKLLQKKSHRNIQICIGAGCGWPRESSCMDETAFQHHIHNIIISVLQIFIYHRSTGTKV